MTGVAPGQDDARLSWAIGVPALLVLGLFGTASGACSRLADSPFVRAGHTGGFWAFGAACVGVEVLAYGVLWPLGTRTLGRPRTPWSLVFGLAWGLTQGLVFLGIYELTDGLAPWWRGVVTWLAASAFQGVWHALFWDLRVSPPHNDPAWNARKVLFAHVPNLTVTVIFLVREAEPWLFVGFQALALVICAAVMRFPGPRGVTSTQRRGVDMSLPGT